MITGVFVLFLYLLTKFVFFFYIGEHFKLESIINKWKKLKQQYKQHHDNQKQKQKVGLNVERNRNSLMAWIKYVITGIHLHPHVLLIQVYLMKVEVNYFLCLAGGVGPAWYM